MIPSSSLLLLLLQQRNQMIMGRELECNTGLGLGIGISHENDHQYNYCNISRKSPPPPVQFHILFPPKHEQQEEEELEKEKPTKRAKKKIDQEEEEEEEHEHEQEVIKDKSGSTRKKLKLTKEQSTFLEDSFREHHTLNLNQKQELADRLNLRPRQVEVWFQNRRARNKLKQTEVECQMLRKWCESLSSENRRLKKELQELRSAAKLPKAAAAATTTATATPPTLSPSFQRNHVSTGGGGRSPGNSSMAC